ncbi:hypothetical protein [Paenibacillus sp. Soil750]|uniref:hypothetical protein n=1 Tax=Paenibacillus sp. Soil750 TaxID=1736398 RepID=UPI0006F90C4A|nr:hypothetical protein [Paenibacillus sp. Soil750]KRE56574.1 hypothetical protein ASL11_32915 [Paenibacillus sp. Soil750]
MLRKLAEDKTCKIKEIEQQENDKCLDSILGKHDELSILQADQRIINEMIADCDWTIEWLESGRWPGNKRGIERRATYQREKSTMPVKINGQLKSSSKYATMSVSEQKAYFSHAVMLAVIEELGWLYGEDFETSRARGWGI